MARCTRFILSCLILAFSLDAFCALNAEDDPTLDVIRSQDEQERDPKISTDTDIDLDSLHCENPNTTTNTVTVLSGKPYFMSSKIQVQCHRGLYFANGLSNITVSCNPVPDPCMCKVFWMKIGTIIGDFNCKEKLHCKNPKSKNNTVTVMSGAAYHMGCKIRVQCRPGLHFGNGESEVTVSCEPVPDPCMCVVFWTSIGNILDDLNCTDFDLPKCKNPNGRNNTVALLAGKLYDTNSKIRVQCPDGLQLDNGMSDVIVRCVPAPHPCQCIALWMTTDFNIMNDLNCTGNHGSDYSLDGREGTLGRGSEQGEEVRHRKLDTRNNNEVIRGNQRRAVGEAIPEVSEFPETSIETNDSPANIENSELANKDGEQETSETNVETNLISSNEENVEAYMPEETRTDKSESHVSSVDTDKSHLNEEESNSEVEEPLQEETTDGEVPETTDEIIEVPENEEKVEHYIEEAEETEHEEEFQIHELEEENSLRETAPLQQPPVLMENTDAVNNKEPEFDSEYEEEPIENKSETVEEEESETEEEHEDLQEMSENETELQPEEQDEHVIEQEEQEITDHERAREQEMEAEEFENNYEHAIQEEVETQSEGKEEQEIIDNEIEAPEEESEHEHVDIHEDETKQEEEIENEAESEERNSSEIPNQNEFGENIQPEEIETEIKEHENEETWDQHQTIDEETVERKDMMEEEERETQEEEQDYNNLLPYEDNYLETEESDNDFDTSAFDWAAISANNAEEYEEMTNEIGQLDDKAQLKAAQLFKYQTSLQPEQIKGESIILGAILDPLSKQEDDDVDATGEEEVDWSRVEDEPEIPEADAEDVESPGWFTDIQQEPVGESLDDTVFPAEIDDVCSLPAETGPCRMYLRRYFFNSKTKECELFVYGGCNGNRNNFESLRDCMDRCLQDIHS